MQSFLEEQQLAYASFLASRLSALKQARMRVRQHLIQELKEVALELPSFQSGPNTGIHLPTKRVLSEFVRRTRCRLSELVRLLRGQTDLDPRPNKALTVLEDAWATTTPVWNHIVQEGLRPPFQPNFPAQGRPPPNHGSARGHVDAVRAALRDGQEKGRILIVDLDLLSLWPEVFCSPLGTVAKDNDPTKVRVVHDLSFPEGASVNDYTIQDLVPPAHYNGPAAIAARILDLAKGEDLIYMATSDVSGAFRHIPLHESYVAKFAATLPEDNALIIDLCTPFGWTASPGFYNVAAGLISQRYGASRPLWPDQPIAGRASFSSLYWCDDHVCVEADIGSRLAEARLALRWAMVSVLGPESYNEAKDQDWTQRCRALGLEWNLQDKSLSMPKEKVDKALRRIKAAKPPALVSKSTLLKLLGSLRHVMTCFPSARAFVQDLSAMANALHRTTPMTRLSLSAEQDMAWFEQILQRGFLNGVQLSIFTRQAQPDVVLFMDASDVGLAALNPQRREYIQVQFSDAERQAMAERQSAVGINVRELSSAAYALLAWGPEWRQRAAGKPIHVRLFIDNSSAVAWNQRRSSSNPTAQNILRLLSFLEVIFCVHCTASHVPGHLNEVADAGSRVWSSHAHASRFSHFCSSWRQVPIEPAWRNLSAFWEQNCRARLWHPPPLQSTEQFGVNGLRGVDSWAFLAGSKDPGQRTLSNLALSLLTVGGTASTTDGATEIAALPSSASSLPSSGSTATTWGGKSTSGQVSNC